MKRLAIILTHPVQYYSPLFQQLSERAKLEIKVFYTWGEASGIKKYDHGFGKEFEWDIPLLEGYPFEFLKNTSSQPGGHHFKGVINPDGIKVIQRYKPDAILIFGWAFVSHLKILRHFKNNIPIIFRGDSTLLDEQQDLKTIARYYFLRWVYSHVDKALYVGKNNYDYYIKFGLKPSQLKWAPHAIDNNRFMQRNTVEKQDGSDLRKTLNIPNGHFVFLFAGKFEAKKDPLTLLQAFVAAAFPPEVHIVFTGNGVLEKDLKSAAASNSNIHFLDFQNQRSMPSLYRMSDVFILPSKGPGETWGLSVNEAMACGRPVIVSNKCGCAPDLVENAVNGYIFEAGNLEDLKNKMISMYTSKDQLANMREASLKKIRSYSIEAICESLEDMVSSL